MKTIIYILLFLSYANIHAQGSKEYIGSFDKPETWFYDEIQYVKDYRLEFNIETPINDGNFTKWEMIDFTRVINSGYRNKYYFGFRYDTEDYSNSNDDLKYIFEVTDIFRYHENHHKSREIFWDNIYQSEQTTIGFHYNSKDKGTIRIFTKNSRVEIENIKDFDQCITVIMSYMYEKCIMAIEADMTRDNIEDQLKRQERKNRVSEFKAIAKIAALSGLVYIASSNSSSSNSEKSYSNNSKTKDSSVQSNNYSSSSSSSNNSNSSEERADNYTIEWEFGEWESPSISDYPAYDRRIKIKGLLKNNGYFVDSHSVWIKIDSNEHASERYHVVDVFIEEFVTLQEAQNYAQQEIIRILEEINK